MLRGQLDAVVRHQINERIMLRRQSGMHRAHHRTVILRTGNRQHIRKLLTDLLRALAQTAGHDDLAVLGHGLADGIQRFLDRRVDEAAGVDYHHVGLVVGRHDVVAFHPQLGQNALGIDQGLGAAETDETDFRVGL